jgi:hypothetical protein
MKAHSLTIYSIAAICAFNYFSVKEISQAPASRMPASLKNVKKKAPAKSASEVKALKEKLAILTAKLESKNKEIDKVESLKKEIADLTVSIKEAKIKDSEELQNSLCLSKRHETELEEQIKKQLKDKEEILQEFELLKKEVKQAKVSPPNPASVAVQPPVQLQGQGQNSDVVNLMAQITSMLQSQQQNQFQMQIQMMNMFSQMNYNLTPSSMMMSNSLSSGLGGYGIGLGEGYSSLMQNPYSTVPMSSPIMRAQIPMNAGFDFTNTLPVLNQRSQVLSLAQ